MAPPTMRSSQPLSVPSTAMRGTVNGSTRVRPACRPARAVAGAGPPAGSALTAAGRSVVAPPSPGRRGSPALGAGCARPHPRPQATEIDTRAVLNALTPRRAHTGAPPAGADVAATTGARLTRP